ncbi:uncharacterized protein LOC110185744 [Drosophila serrata]|uniref:uncharacterized protein LOC110185744 n=1 Tax=Drosophila serrata TaxID=7274 RepID=UPI000A1CF385|nr:uncharacterized protein LOC110185744 [Drosophila serrata]
MCKCLSNLCTKFRACVFWALLNIGCGAGLIPLVLKFVNENDLPNVVLIFGCLCGVYLIISGILLLIGLIKGMRSLVCVSIVFCGLGMFFIHWLIIPLVLYFIFSFVVFNYYQVDMAPDDRYRVPKRYA